MDGTGWRLLMVTGFGISSAEPLDSATEE